MSTLVNLPNGYQVNLLSAYKTTGISKSNFGEQLRGKHKDFGKVVIKRIISKEKGGVYRGTKFPSLNKEINSIKKRVDHKNIINILFDCVYEGDLWIIYEYCSDKDVHNFLKINHKDEHISVPESIDIMAQCADGLNYLNNLAPPIIHGFIKPQNILFKRNDNQYVVKITDYMLASVFEGNPFKKTTVSWSSFEGTSDLSQSEIERKVYNTAPEYLNEEAHKKTRSSDVFCMGIVFHAILSHDIDALDVSLVPVIPGWAGTSIAAYVKSNSEPTLFLDSAESDENKLHTIIEGMLCRDPNDRTPMTTVAEQLQAVIKNKKTTQDILEEVESIPNNGFSVEDESSQNTRISEEEDIQNSIILKKLIDILQQQGPMDAADKRLMDALTDAEGMHILRTAASVANFVSQYCNAINIEDGQLKYKPPVDPEPPLDKAKVEEMGNMLCTLMTILEKNIDVINNVNGHYANAITEKLYLHIPPAKRGATEQRIRELLSEDGSAAYILPFIEFQDHEELVVIQESNADRIQPFIALGSRIMTDPDLKYMKQVQEGSLWDGKIFKDICNARYGTLGCFARNAQKTEAFAITAKHVVENNNGSPNIISVTIGDNIVTKEDTVVNENIHLKMQDCTYITSSFEGLRGVNPNCKIVDPSLTNRELVDIAYAGPFSQSFSSNHEDFQERLANKIGIYQPKQYLWDLTPVRIVGATSGLQKGRIVCSNYLVTCRTQKNNNELKGTAFLVSTCDEGSTQCHTDNTFSKPGDSGSVVFLDDENEVCLKALGVVLGKITKPATIYGTVYNNLTFCTYLDVGMRVLENIYGGQLELYDYTYRPKYRLKQDLEQVQNLAVAADLPRHQMDTINEVEGVLPQQKRGDMQREGRNITLIFFVLAFVILVIAVIMSYI